MAITTCSAPAVSSFCRRLWKDSYLQRSISRIMQLKSLLNSSKGSGMFMSYLRNLGRTKFAMVTGGRKNKQLHSDDQV